MGQTRESIRLALDTLRGHRLRSGLTILGIVIGVSSVITISSVINGINLRVNSFIDSLGTNVFWVYHMPLMGVRPTSEMLTRKKLTLDDALALSSLPHVIATDAEYDYQSGFHVGGVSAKYRGRKVSGTNLEGNTSRFFEGVVDVPLLEGRFFTSQEDQHDAHICLLGHDTWEALFDDQPAVGKEIVVGNGLYTVIGVLDKMKQAFGSGKNPYDNIIYFPLGTFHHLHPEISNVRVAVKYDDPINKALVEEEIRELMRVRRRVGVLAPDDFEIFSPDGLTKLWTELTGGLVLFMIAVSSVGLVVGGVGVMNIMLVSVTERTREIGVRKAIGATRRTLLTQFTTEAITLCAIGGLLGIVLGAALTWIVCFLPIGIPATVSSLWVIAGFAVSCGIGLLFGIYPAWKAATLDPIEALRYE